MSYLQNLNLLNAAHFESTEPVVWGIWSCSMLHTLKSTEPDVWGIWSCSMLHTLSPRNQLSEESEAAQCCTLWVHGTSCLRNLKLLNAAHFESTEPDVWGIWSCSMLHTFKSKEPVVWESWICSMLHTLQSGILLPVLSCFIPPQVPGACCHTLGDCIYIYIPPVIIVILAPATKFTTLYSHLTFYSTHPLWRVHVPPLLTRLCADAGDWLWSRFSLPKPRTPCSNSTATAYLSLA